MILFLYPHVLHPCSEFSLSAESASMIGNMPFTAFFQTLPKSASVCSKSTQHPNILRLFFDNIWWHQPSKDPGLLKSQWCWHKVLVFFFPLVWPFADSLLTNTPKLEHQILHWFWQVCMWQFHSLWFSQIIKHSFELSRLRTVAKVFYLNWKK